MNRFIVVRVGSEQLEIWSWREPWDIKTVEKLESKALGA